MSGIVADQTLSTSVQPPGPTSLGLPSLSCTQALISLQPSVHARASYSCALEL